MISVIGTYCMCAGILTEFVLAVEIYKGVDFEPEAKQRVHMSAALYFIAGAICLK